MLQPTEGWLQGRNYHRQDAAVRCRTEPLQGGRWAKVTYCRFSCERRGEFAVCLQHKPSTPDKLQDSWQNSAASSVAARCQRLPMTQRQVASLEPCKERRCRLHVARRAPFLVAKHATVAWQDQTCRQQRQWEAAELSWLLAQLEYKQEKTL